MRCVIFTDSDKSLAAAAAMLADGALVAFPTETVYGLGANALLPKAVAGIYEAKGRPSNNPLIVHVASVEQAQQYVQWNEAAQKLADHFWPAALTLILPRRVDCPLAPAVSAWGNTVAIRMPAHAVARRLLALATVPVAAPSANPSGCISPTCAQHVTAHLGQRIDAVVDGGACDVGVESTVVDVSGDAPMILRAGSVTLGQLQKILPNVQMQGGGVDEGGVMASPGLLSKHYAPNAKVRLNVNSVESHEALLAFGEPIAGAEHVFQLSVSCDVSEAAERLFAGLHQLDALGVSGIAVMPIPNEGVGVAINDRLQRAAA